jgi:mRNA-degrading endonuclease RelE of RelBE toxin-antitoxin system
MAYRVEVEQAAVDALARLRATDRARLLRAIREQLTHEPHRETASRKPMRDDGAGAAWELHVQPYRVYYDIDEDKQTVWVVKIARNDRETARDVS